MASQHQVKEYLAYWMQLGKKVLIQNGQVALFSPSIIQGDRYSPEFEHCWQQTLLPSSGDCYLEGTHETITELLSPTWEIIACGRCAMPLPIRTVGMPPQCCPCHDLLAWPNLDLPTPRSPISTNTCLQEICQRLPKEASAN